MPHKYRTRNTDSPKMSVRLFFLLPLTTLAVAGVQELWWNVTYVQDADPDGLFPRQVIGVNGTWP